MADKKDKDIKVAVRVRKLIKREEDLSLKPLWTVEKGCQIALKGDTRSTPWIFDRVFDQNCTTETVYDDLVKPIVDKVMMGFNGTVFAYGQTASGKTYTMMGSNNIATNDLDASNSQGILTRCVRDIYNAVESTPDREFLIRVAYIEIYNEILVDLLDPNQQIMNVEVDGDGKVSIYNVNDRKVFVTENVVRSTLEALKVVKLGEKARHYGSTAMNEKSSRSHTIVRLIVESKERGDDSASAVVLVSEFNLVDLAGSENAKQTGATGGRLTEGAFINKSLTTLSMVINQLSSGASFVSYRDCKLTRILQNALGGNSMTAFICCVTPATVDETKSTLHFASSAKTVKNRPIVNEAASDNEALMRKYRRQITELEQQLEKTRISDVANLQQQLEEQVRIGNEKDSKILALSNMLSLSSQIPAVDGSDKSKARNKRRETWCGGQGGRQFPVALMPGTADESFTISTDLVAVSQRRRPKAAETTKAGLFSLEECNEVDSGDDDGVEYQRRSFDQFVIARNKRSFDGTDAFHCVASVQTEPDSEIEKLQAEKERGEADLERLTVLCESMDEELRGYKSEVSSLHSSMKSVKEEMERLTSELEQLKAEKQDALIENAHLKLQADLFKSGLEHSKFEAESLSRELEQSRIDTELDRTIAEDVNQAEGVVSARLAEERARWDSERKELMSQIKEAFLVSEGFEAQLTLLQNQLAEVKYERDISVADAKMYKNDLDELTDFTRYEKNFRDTSILEHREEARREYQDEIAKLEKQLKEVTESQKLQLDQIQRFENSQADLVAMQAMLIESQACRAHLESSLKFNVTNQATIDDESSVNLVNKEMKTSSCQTDTLMQTAKVDASSETVEEVQSQEVAECHDSELQVRTAEREQLHIQLEKAQLDLVALQEQLEQQQHHLKQQKESLEEQTALAIDAQDELIEVNEKVYSLELELKAVEDRLTREKQDLTQQLEKAISDHQLAEHRFQEAENELSNVTRELSSVLEKVDTCSIRLPSEQKLQEQIKKMQVQIDLGNQRCANYESKLKNLEAELKTCDASSKVSFLQARADEVQYQLEEKQKELQDLKKTSDWQRDEWKHERTQLVGKLEELRAATDKQVLECEKNLAAAIAEREESFHSVVQLKSACEKTIQHAEEEITRLQNRHAEEIVRLQSDHQMRLDSQERQHQDEMTRHATDLAVECGRRISEQTSEIEKIAQDMASLQSENASARQMVCDLEDKIASIKISKNAEIEELNRHVEEIASREDVAGDVEIILTSKESKIADLELKLADVSHQHDVLVNNLRRQHMEELDSLKAEHNDKLQHVTSAMQREIDALSSKLESIRIVKESEMADLEQLKPHEVVQQADVLVNNLHHQHKEEIDSLNAKHEDKLKQVTSALQREIDELSSKLESIRTAKESEMADLELKLTDVSRQHDVLVNSLHQQHMEAIDSLKAEHEDKVKQITSSTQREIDELLLKLEEVRCQSVEQLENLRFNHLREIKSLNSEHSEIISHLEMRLESGSSELLTDDKQHDIQHLKHELTEKEDKIAHLERVINEGTVFVNQIKAEKEDLEAELDEADTERENFLAELNVRENAAKTLSQELEVVKKALEDAKSQYDELLGRNEVNHQATIVIEKEKQKELLSSLDKCLSERDELASTVKCRDVEIDDLQSDISMIKSEKEQLQTAFDHLHSDISLIKSEKEQLQATLDYLQSDLRLIKSEKEKLQAALDDLQSDLSLTKSEKEKLQAAFDKISNDYERLQQELLIKPTAAPGSSEHLQQRIDELNEELAIVGRRYRGLKLGYNTLEKNGLLAQLAQREAENKLAMIVGEIKGSASGLSFADALKGHESKIAKLEEERRQLAFDLQETNNDWSETKTKLREREEELEQLKGHFKSIEDQLTVKVRTLSDELEKQRPPVEVSDLRRQLADGRLHINKLEVQLQKEKDPLLREIKGLKGDLERSEETRRRLQNELRRLKNAADTTYAISQQENVQVAPSAAAPFHSTVKQETLDPSSCGIVGMLLLNKSETEIAVLKKANETLTKNHAECKEKLEKVRSENAELLARLSASNRLDRQARPSPRRAALSPRQGVATCFDNDYLPGASKPANARPECKQQ